MKTTIELPDDLLIKAKAVAAMRRTTLKAMIEHALKREIDYPEDAEEENEHYIIGKHGMPILKPKGGDREVTSEDIYKLMEELGI